MAAWASGPSRPGITGPLGRRYRGTRGPARSRERPWGQSGVYTDRRKRPISAILGHLCTLLGCCAVVDRRGDAEVYTNRWKWPLGAVSGHLCTLLGCCAVVDRRGDAGVYTDRRKRPFGAVSGHLCTLLRRESRYESRRELRQVARAPQPPRRAGGTPSLAPLAWSGRQTLREWRRCQVGIFAKASTHTNPRRARCCSAFGKAQFQDDATAGRMYGDKEGIPWT